MAKWMKVLLGVVLSLAVFGGVAAWVNDMHPLGGASTAYTRMVACQERSRNSGLPSTPCLDAYRREAAAIGSNERWVSAAAGAATVALLWLLAYFFYFRPRRGRAEVGQP